MNVTAQDAARQVSPPIAPAGASSAPQQTDWCQIGYAKDIPKGSVRTVVRSGREIVLFRGKSGSLQATEAACPHLGAHLGAGRVDGDLLRCPFHGWGISARSGAVSDIPGLKCVPNRLFARTLPIREHGGVLFGHAPGSPELPPGETSTSSLPLRLEQALSAASERRASRKRFTVSTTVPRFVESVVRRYLLPDKWNLHRPGPPQVSLGDSNSYECAAALAIKIGPLPERSAVVRVEVFDSSNVLVETRFRSGATIETLILCAPTASDETEVLRITSAKGRISGDVLSHLVWQYWQFSVHDRRAIPPKRRSKSDRSAQPNNSDHSTTPSAVDQLQKWCK